MLKRVEKSESSSDRLINELKKEGIVLFTNRNIDEEYLQLPEDITEVQSSELGKYLSVFTQQKLWVRTLIGKVTLELNEIQVELDIRKSKEFSNLPAKMPVKEKELYLLKDKNYAEMYKQFNYYASKLKILEDYIISLEDGIFNISREITRRGSDFKSENVEHGASKRFAKKV